MSGFSLPWTETAAEETFEDVMLHRVNSYLLLRDTMNPPFVDPASEKDDLYYLTLLQHTLHLETFPLAPTLANIYALRDILVYSTRSSS